MIALVVIATPAIVFVASNAFLRFGGVAWILPVGALAGLFIAQGPEFVLSSRQRRPIAMAICGFVGFFMVMIMVPSWQGNRKLANEYKAQVAMREFVNTQQRYHALTGEYADSSEQLIAKAGLDSSYTAYDHGSYTAFVVKGWFPVSLSPTKQAFGICIAPTAYGDSAIYSYYTNASGMIWIADFGNAGAQPPPHGADPPANSGWHVFE